MPRSRSPALVLRRIGRRIREIRRDRGLSQVELAAQLDIARQFLSRVELGRHNISIRFLADLGGVLGVEVEAFLEPPRSLTVRRGRPPTPRG